MKVLYQNSKLTLAILLACTSCLIYLTNRYILTAEFYENNGDPFYSNAGQSAAVYAGLQKWVYLTSAIFLVVKVGTIALVLKTALYLNDEEIPFHKVFGVVVACEYVFLVPAAIKLISFNYTFEHPNLLDWHRYNILSLLSFFPNVPAGWYYALGSLNLFEMTYWFSLAYGLSLICSRNFDDSLRLILTSYVPSLFVWIVAVTFVTLMMFPTTG